MPNAWRRAEFNRRYAAFMTIAMVVGCGDAGSQHADARTAAYAAVNEGNAAFNSRDYTSAEPKLASAIASQLLNPDVYCEASVRHAVCLGSARKFDEALAELDAIGPGAPNIDQIYAARSYVLAKQGKAAESRAALAKARQANRAVQEFKD